MTDREDYQAEVRALRDVSRPAKPVRLSLSDVLALLLTRRVGDSDSVTLKENAKLETQIEVTVRSREGETILDAEARATEAYDRLRDKYAASEVRGDAQP